MIGSTRTQSHASAVDPGQARWPVVIFSPGYGASRAFYTSLLSDLASRGFIVLAVDHPYESAITQLVDGSLATPIERFLPEDSIRFHYMVRHTAIRVADLRAVLDAVVDSTERTPFGALAGRMDHTRIAAVGHSFGGAASVATAAVDSRVRASVNIDGTLYGSLPDQALTQPFLLIESDRDETKHGRQFVDGHGATDGQAAWARHAVPDRACEPLQFHGCADDACAAVAVGGVTGARWITRDAGDGAGHERSSRGVSRGIG